MARCTFLLATQRSGSTFVERVLTRTELAGNFDEHFLEFIDPFRRHEPHHRNSPYAFVDALTKARDSSGNFGTTLMAGYTPAVASAFFGKQLIETEDRAIKRTKEFFQEIEKLCGQVDFILITRNPVQQAVSRYFSRNTGLYHIIQGADIRPRPEKKMSQEEAIRSLDPLSILMQAERIRNENGFWNKVLLAAGRNPVRVTYEEVTVSPDLLKNVLIDLDFESAKSAQILVDTQKVVSSDLTERAGSMIAEYLGMPEWCWSKLDEQSRRHPVGAFDERLLTDASKTSKRGAVRRALSAFRAKLAGGVRRLKGR